MNCRRSKICGVTSLVAGSIFLFIGLLVFFLARRAALNRIDEALVVDPTNEENYQKWLTDNRQDAPPHYYSYTFWNLTNANEVRNGGVPNYQSVGPYIYQKYTTKLEVVFSDNGNEVQYLTYTPYFYVPSPGLDPLNDKIVNINPTYVGILITAGGEYALSTIFSPSIFYNIITLMNGPYTSAVIDLTLPSLLLQQQMSLISMINQTTQDTIEAENTFYSIWANSTSTPNYPTFPSAMRVSVTTASGISFSSTSSLFNSSVPFSLTNPDPVSALTWFSAESGLTTDLAQRFELTSAQFNALLSWRNRTKAELFNQLIAAYYKLNDVSSIGLAQWGEANITQQSVRDLLPSLQLPMAPEYALWSQYNNTIPVSVSLELLYGPLSLFEPDFFLEFVYLVEIEAYDVIEAFWGIDNTTAYYLEGYLNEVVYQTFVIYTLQGVFAQGGGLFTSRTVDEWLWSGIDPLLLLINPANPHCNLFTNDTSEAFAIENKNSSSFYTGKDNINLIGQYITYEGQSSINGWEIPVNVLGTDGTQFAPHSPSTTFFVWVGDLLRPVSIDQVQTGVDLYGISLNRFQISPHNLVPNSIYYQSITGMANMSWAYNEVPIFLSQPNMVGVDPVWISKVSGMNPMSTDSQTILDVEPLTGVTMNAHKRLQLNLYIEESPPIFDEFNPNATVGLFYPILYVDESSQITEALANDFKSSVYSPLKLIFGFSVTFFVLGSLLIVIGIIVLLIGCRKRGGYEELEYK